LTRPPPFGARTIPRRTGGGQDHGVGADHVAVELERLEWMSCGGDRDRRSGSEYLLDQRVEVPLVAVPDRLARASLDRRVVRKQLHAPRDRRRGRLVAGGDQRVQLVPEVCVGQSVALLAARQDHQREDVVAALKRRVSPRRDDLLVEHPIEHIAFAPVQLERLVPARAPVHGRVVGSHLGPGQTASGSAATRG
jgi:hypothetical protein